MDGRDTFLNGRGRPGSLPAGRQQARQPTPPGPPIQLGRRRIGGVRLACLCPPGLTKREQEASSDGFPNVGGEKILCFLINRK